MIVKVFVDDDMVCSVVIPKRASSKIEPTVENRTQTLEPDVSNQRSGGARSAAADFAAWANQNKEENENGN
jgi:hypothetical protein